MGGGSPQTMVGGGKKGGGGGGGGSYSAPPPMQVRVFRKEQKYPFNIKNSPLPKIIKNLKIKKNITILCLLFCVILYTEFSSSVTIIKSIVSLMFSSTIEHAQNNEHPVISL